ncbi:hypothetical protein V4F39_08535 [Aquincola sp. MAHUQ-54]|uniref:Uncharacterized protein n=2 Tax=Aquincola agrisoli TaxID=3119538 RepID=A0AAW9QEW7_9BURK
MKRLLTRAALALGAMLLLPAHAADVGVSVSISEPGVYGRVDIGRFPAPQVIVAQPVIVRSPPRGPRPQPVYMWVPPGHQKNWGKHCARYGACGVPVYFVRDQWYHDHVSHDRRRHDDRHRDRHHDRDHGHDRRDRGGDHGPGRGHGKGHDRD